MRKVTIGILAHVDAGKTTLIEQLLVTVGKKSEAGRVDHGTAFLDTDAQERARGITITSKNCHISTEKLDITVVDTPGHVDFTAESERVLPVLDAAVLVVSAGDRLTAHAEYLFGLLRERSIPTVVFFNKMDLPAPDRAELVGRLKSRLGEGFADWYGEKDALYEEAAVLDEGLLETYLSSGNVPVESIRRLFLQGRFHPCCFGSALRGEGVKELLALLDGMFEGGQGENAEESAERNAEPFGAYCYKVLYDTSGQRVSFLKVLSGTLSVRDTVSYLPVRKAGAAGAAQNGTDSNDTPETEELSEKVTQLRRYDGAGFEAVQSAGPGEIIAVTGLTATSAGCGLGIAPSARPSVSRPMLRFRMNLPEGVSPREFLPKLKELEEEEDTLSVTWVADREEIEVELYGEVQLEILTERIRERFGQSVTFDEGNVVYRETLAAPTYGVGHFEPLRHYAEVHFLMEPLPRGAGIQLDSRLSTDELDRSWQQTILTAVEKELLTGVLVNAPLTDLRITLVAGRAHKKHTEGGDFREAALRAIRQGLMGGENLLLEPYVRFSLTVPAEAAGRALYDMGQLGEESAISEQTENYVTVEGRGAVSKLRNYTRTVREYTHGEGLFRMSYDGFDRAADQEEIVEKTGYQPEADLAHPPGSVFVDHGTATYISWEEVPARAHLEVRFDAFYPDEEESAEEDVQRSGRRRPSVEERLEAIGTEEIDRILQQASHANQTGEHAAERRNRWNSANRRGSVSGSGSGARDAGSGSEGRKEKRTRERSPYLLVDGYNIIHAWEETRSIVNQDLTAARMILLDMLTEYRAMSREEVIVVFDAYRVAGHRVETMDYQNIHVVFTREAETADQYISRFTLEHEKHYDITVATSDGLIQMIIHGADAKLLSARELHGLLQMKKEQLRETYLTE